MIGPILMSFFLLATTPPPAEVQVDVGTGNWESLPPLQQVERRLPSPVMVERVETMLSTGTCRIKGQSAKRFDITVPYAVQVKPDGSVNRVVVAEMGCPALESYVGMLVLERAKLGDFVPSKAAEARWLSDTLNFNLR